MTKSGLSGEEFQNKIYEAIVFAIKMLHPGSQTSRRNPAYDWKTGSNPPGMPEYLFGTYTRENFENDCAQIRELIKDLPGELLGQALKKITDGNFDVSLGQVQQELDEALTAAGYPGRIKDFTAIFQLSDCAFQIVLWPEGEIQTYFRVPAYTEYLPRWKHYLKAEQEQIYSEIVISGHWAYAKKQMVLNWKITEANSEEISKNPSKEVFKISNQALANIRNVTKMEIPLVQQASNNFISIDFTLLKY